MESHLSKEGRWIILVLRVNNVTLVVNNIYGHNNNSMAKNMYIQLTSELKKIKDKYNDAHLIIGGDLNDTPDDQMDRMPARILPTSKFKAISHLCEHLNVMDVWRYLHPYHKEYTWSNVKGSLQSRIDLWLLSSHTLQFVSESLHSYAPFSDHKMIVINLLIHRNRQKQQGVVGSLTVMY